MNHRRTPCKQSHRQTTAHTAVLQQQHVVEKKLDHRSRKPCMLDACNNGCHSGPSCSSGTPTRLRRNDKIYMVCKPWLWRHKIVSGDLALTRHAATKRGTTQLQNIVEHRIVEHNCTISFLSRSSPLCLLSFTVCIACMLSFLSSHPCLLSFLPATPACYTHFISFLSSLAT